MSKHNELGKIGEKIAVEFLQRKGCRILETNFRFQHKEVDVIFLDKEVLVFGEIKTRGNIDNEFPEEAVGPRKQAAIKLAAGAYANRHRTYVAYRFDVLSIFFRNGSLQEILHFEDAF